MHALKSSWRWFEYGKATAPKPPNVRADFGHKSQGHTAAQILSFRIHRRGTGLQAVEWILAIRELEQAS